MQEHLICTNHPGTDAAAMRCNRCLRPFCTNCLVSLGGRSYCADCKLEQVRDVQSGVSMYVLPLATVGRRWAALIIDRLLIMGPAIVGLVAFLVTTNGGENVSAPAPWILLLIVWGIAAMLYEPLMTSRDGQTLGKKAMGIRVVRIDGSRITPGQSWGRFGGRILISMISALIDYLPALFTDQKTTIHDLMANTRVVREN